MSRRLKEHSRIRDTVEAKIQRLKDYCKQYPYLFAQNVRKTLLEKLIEENKQEEIEYLEKIYLDYIYITSRRAQGQLSKEVELDLKASKIGGVFGILEDDEKLHQKYGITYKQISELYQNFGSIDNFRKSYIQYKIDLSNAQNDEDREKVIAKNDTLLKHAKDLPIIGNFYLCGNKNYNFLAKAILKYSDQYYRSLIFDSDIDSVLDSLIDTLNIREKQVIQLRFGLKDDKPKDLESVGKYFDVSRERVRQIEAKALRKLKNIKRKNALIEHVYEADEEFFISYFETHDIFYNEDEPRVENEEAERLVEKYREKEKIKKQKIKEELEEKHDRAKNITLNDIELSVRAHNCLYHAGIGTVEDLFRRIETEKDFLQIRNLGEKTKEEIINKIHDLGLKFDFEKDNVKTILKANNEPNKILIKDLKLSTRSSTALQKRANIENLEELLSKIETLDDLYLIRNLGEKSVNEIINAVHKLGYKFKFEINEDNNLQNEDYSEEMLLSFNFNNLDEACSQLDNKINILNNLKERIFEKINKISEDLKNKNGEYTADEVSIIMKQVNEILKNQTTIINNIDENIKLAVYSSMENSISLNGIKPLLEKPSQNEIGGRE